MSYSDFSAELLRRNFGIQIVEQALFVEIGAIEPTPWLEQSIALGKNLAYASEKARSEFIVAPVLVATCKEILEKNFQIFSGVRLDTAVEGLKGECDFIIGRSGTVLSLQSPLMLIVEAKKNDIEEGIGQCGAQMLGARAYNEQDGIPLPYVFGCVTTGESWQFLKLMDSHLLLHPVRFSLKEIQQILWILVECLTDLDRLSSSQAA